MMFGYSPIKPSLLGDAALAALAIGLIATPAGARAAAAPAPAQAPAVDTASNAEANAAEPPEIIVTGTLFKRRIDSETPSPVTILSADTLTTRGISTISDALQTLTANGAGTLPVAFSANGAFAGGASAPSLRGLTTDSTLVLFDGLRAAYYPLSDDGTRNFVDTNTIPDSIVDRIDVLKDGASSTYGADAVAGVINVIIKKEIKGFHGTAEGGVTQRGDGAHQRLSATYGWGDLKEKGYNFYVNVEYQNDGLIYNKNRAFPFNTQNYTSITGRAADGTIIHGNNANYNGLQADGTLSGLQNVPVAEVAPVDANGDLIPGAVFNPINANLGCNGLTPHVINGTVGALNVGTVCEYDPINSTYFIQPHNQRLGATAHFTAQINDNTQAYAMFTYYQNRSSFGGYPGPSPIRDTTTTGDYSTKGSTPGIPEIFLPAVLTAGPNAGQLNPNDPFAAQGYGARIYYSFADIPIYTEQFNQVYRGAAGINGSFGNDWTYQVDVTGMNSDLKTTQEGQIYVAGLLGAIADGSYNFMNPAANSEAVRQRIAPTDVSYSRTQLYQGQATITKPLFYLPSGQRLNVAVGGSVRYESLYDPSANPDNPTDPTQQYLAINPFGAIGHRWVESGYFEIDAPVLKQLEINGSGRYDHYSVGFSHFSPKIGVKFQPIRQIAFRGTFSKGFRVPSFAESGALPTTGYSNYTPDPNSAFAAAHLLPNGQIDQYAQSYLLGTTTAGNPQLRPEISTNLTAGFVAQPTRWLSFTADYFRIKKKHVIVTADASAALDQYYNTGTVPAGYSIVLDGPDPLHPGEQQRIRSITSGFINANSLETSGIDMSASATVRLADGVKWTSSGEATYVINYDETLPGVGTEHFAGTLGPINYTSGAGTPRWQANWQNTFDIGKWTLTATAYYTSGYKTTSEDVFGPGTNTCSGNNISAGIFDDNATPIRCHVKAFVDLDMHLAYALNEHFTLYSNVKNVLDSKPPFDPVTYGGIGYNPAYAEAGIVGRYMEVGANVTF